MENSSFKALPFAFLPLSGEKRPGIAAARTGVTLGVFSTLFSWLLLLAVHRFLPMAEWGQSAAANLTDLSQIALFLYAVVCAPVLETFTGQVIPIEIARRFRANNYVCILSGGAAFGLGHFLNGGVIHGLCSFFSGAIFSFGYVMFRALGVRPAFIVSATAHAI